MSHHDVLVVSLRILSFVLELLKVFVQEGEVCKVVFRKLELIAIFKIK